MCCFVGCEENLVDVLTKRQLHVGVLAQLQVQVRQDPQKSVFGLWAQAMVLKPSPRYGERFAACLARFAIPVVEKSALT